MMLLLAAEYLKQVRTGLWVQGKGITTNDFSYKITSSNISRPFGGTSSYEDPSLLLQ